MDIQEKKIGRVFRGSLNEGEDLFEEIYKFAEKEGIRETSLFVIGTAFGENTTFSALQLVYDQISRTKGRDSFSKKDFYRNAVGPGLFH